MLPLVVLTGSFVRSRFETFCLKNRTIIDHSLMYLRKREKDGLEEYVKEGN